MHKGTPPHGRLAAQDATATSGSQRFPRWVDAETHGAMANWNKPGYWRWWWNYRAGPEAKLFTVLTPVLLLAALGFALAGRLPTEVEAASRLETFTVERVVTIQSDGQERVVTRPVSVVRRVTGPVASGIETRVVVGTVTTPGGERVVTTFQSVVSTVEGTPRTTVQTLGGATRTDVVTNERVVTDRRVVTNERVVTNDRTVTDVRTQEVTVPVTTVRTVRETVEVTQTVTAAATQVLTETVTLPAVTLPPETVTVTCPPKGCDR